MSHATDVSTDVVERAATLITAIVDSAKEAAAAVANGAANDKTFMPRLRERMRGIVTQEYLRRLLMLGRGEIIPEVFIGVNHQALVSKLTVEEQREVVFNGVKIPVGEDDHRVVRLPALSHDDAYAAMRYGCLVTVEEQREYKKSRERRLTRAGDQVVRDYTDRATEILGQLNATMNTRGIHINGDFFAWSTIEALGDLRHMARCLRVVQNINGGHDA